MIYVSDPLLGENAQNYVQDCLKTSWISSTGEYLDKFEKGWSSYCGATYGVAVSNGTAALQLALKALGLKKGDEVIIPSFTIISCAIAVIEAGAKPVLVDCDLDTWCMNIKAVKNAITSRTKAIMPVHMFGHPVDMDPLIELAEEFGLYIIEDAAEAHGAKYKGRRVGSLGKISCFSFYANKIITTGEGGMILTSDPDIAERVRSLRNLCFSSERRFLHKEIGYNYRMTNIQAAIGLSQIENIEKHIQIKRSNAAYYSSILKTCGALKLPIEKEWARNVYWMYGVLLPKQFSINAKKLADLLFEKGIETRPLFLGMHQQPIFKQMGLFSNLNLPNTEYLAEQGLYLPSGFSLTTEQIEYICETVVKIIKNYE